MVAAMAVGAMLLFVCALATRSQADPSAMTYYPYFGASNLGTITSATTVTLSRMGTLSSYPLTLGTGGTSNFTVTLVLSDSNFNAGDKLELPVAYPAASGQQMLAVYDGGTNGTLLHSSTCTALAGTALLEFVNITGTVWTYTPEGDLGTRTLAPGAQNALQAALNSSSGLVTGSGLANGSAAYATTAGSAAVSGSASLSGSAVSAGTAYSLANATGALSTQASIQLPPVLSSTSISGCVEDLDGDQPAGTGTNSVPPNSTVTTWVALTGGNATALSGSNAPVWQPGKGMYFNGSAVMSIPSVVSASTYAIVIDYTPGLPSNSPLLYTGNWQDGQVVFSSTNNINSGVNCQIIGVPGWGGYFGGVTPAQTGEGNTIITSFDSTNMIYQDGFPQTFYQGGLQASIANNTLYLGNEGGGVGGYNFVGWIRRLRIFNRVPLASEYASIFASDAGRYKCPASNELIVDGDSISSLITNNALTKMGLPAYLNGIWDIRSAAWGGKTLSADTADDAAFAAMQDIRHPAPVVKEWLGTNDIYANLVSGSNAYASLVTRCLARRAAGNRIAVETMLPRASANEESQRQIFNGLVRANFRQFADAIIDLKDLAPTMDNYATNFTTISGTNYLTTTGSTQYQGDLIHPTAYGASLIAQAEASVINGMTPASSVAPVSSTTGQILVSTTSIGMNAVWTGAAPGGNVAMSTDGAGGMALTGNATLSGLLVSSEIGKALGHWYPFTVNLTEDAIGGYNLSNYQGVTSGTGNIGGAAVFTGSNTLTGPSPIFTSGTSFSASCWFWAPNVTNNQCIIGAYNVGSNGYWFMSMASGALSGYVGNSSGGNAIPSSISVSSSTWNFCSITYNAATGAVSVTVSGTTNTATLSGLYSAPPTPFCVGAFYYGGSLNNPSNTYFLTGRIADVRLCPGVCLSPSAVNTEYTEGIANGIVSQNLYLSGTAAAPANSGTAATWGLVTTPGGNYKLPLYQ